MNRISTDANAEAITANLRSLQVLLAAAATRSSEAYVLSQRGEFNQAIGTVLGLDTILDDAKALYGAAIVLHRLNTN